MDFHLQNLSEIRNFLSVHMHKYFSSEILYFAERKNLVELLSTFFLLHMKSGKTTNQIARKCSAQDVVKIQVKTPKQIWRTKMLGDIQL